MNLQRLASFATLACLCIAATAAGCQMPSQPWAGTPYQPPQGLDNPAQSTYAPMPTILPGRRAPRIDPASQDRQLEKLLFGETESTVDQF